MMRFAAALTVAVLVFSLPYEGLAQKKKGKAEEDVPVATPDELAALNGVREINGKLLLVDSGTDSKTLNIRVEYQEYEANPKYKPHKATGNPNAANNYQNTMNRLMQEQQRAFQMKNPAQMQAALNRVQTQYMQLVNKMNNDSINQSNHEMQAYLNDVKTNNFPYLPVTKHKDAVLEVQDNVTVRRAKMPTEYDDKGFLKEYSKDELDKLHKADNKDGKKPGYPAKYEELAAGMKVTLGLTPAKKPAPAKKVDPAEKKDDAPAPKTSRAPTIRLILITDESMAQDPGTSSSPKKKKKN